MRKTAMALLCSAVLAAAAGISSTGYAFEAREQLNINTVRAEELAEVPGIDMELARSIVAYRDEHGPFSSVDKLLRVKGMDEKKLEAARMYLTVETQTHLE